MPSFSVTQIIDGDTFTVTPGWTWNGTSGNRVPPAGYDAPEVGTPGAAVATTRLLALILNKLVQLASGYRVDRERIVCEVFLHGRNLKEFFPQYN